MTGSYIKILQTQLLEAVTVNSDSRYPDKLHKLLKEMLELGMNILIYTLSKATASNQTLSTLD